MGLTRSTVNENKTTDDQKYDFKIALAGNPNVGKSTVFNALTGLNQHTGNWPGKTVNNAVGYFKENDKQFKLVDLPGTYSLLAKSAEEEVARDYICNSNSDCVIVVADATCLERNLILTLQILSISTNVLLCVNLLDEAKKKGISVDLDELSLQLGIPVVGTSARSKKGLNELKNTSFKLCTKEIKCFKVKSLLPENYSLCCTDNNNTSAIEEIIAKSEEIYQKCVKTKKVDYNERDRVLDKILTSKLTGIPIMLLLLGIIFWITAAGANYPSQWLSNLFDYIKEYLFIFFQFINAPIWLQNFFIQGVYTTLTWVVAVMLPPMAIFFPLFTLLEDSGYLPRIAFNLDKYFKKSNAHGKQALTMTMGIGCNACGVMGCRIIDSPRERLIAILTNNFVPCNGRLPTLIAIISIFFTASLVGFFKSLASALLLLSVIVFAVFTTLMVSKFLSKTILKGIPSSFILELPPYRRPQFLKVIVRSIFDRTLFVLGRAVVVAIPAGTIIWIMANFQINDISILKYCTDFFDPFGRLLGLDGVIIMAFILGFPANEIVIPIILMAYMSTGTLTDYSNLNELFTLLTSNGWTLTTAICTIIMCLFHSPCSTTCLTIHKETKSIKWTLVSMIIPILLGIMCCMIINGFSSLIF